MLVTVEHYKVVIVNDSQTTLCGAQTEFAADAVFAQPEEQTPIIAGQPTWAVQITPYVWAASLKGDISAFRSAPSIGIKKSFSDVLDDLNFGGFVHVWGRYVLDVDYNHAGHVYDTRLSGPVMALTYRF